MVAGRQLLQTLCFRESEFKETHNYRVRRLAQSYTHLLLESINLGGGMSKKTKQWYSLTEEQLERLAGQRTYPEAPSAWTQVRAIKERGHKASIFYNGFSGFRILDEDDPEQFKIGQSIASRAKPFQM